MIYMFIAFVLFCPIECAIMGYAWIYGKIENMVKEALNKRKD